MLRTWAARHRLYSQPPEEGCPGMVMLPLKMPLAPSARLMLAGWEAQVVLQLSPACRERICCDRQPGLADMCPISFKHAKAAHAARGHELD